MNNASEEELCPKCGHADLYYGYGLAGGGVGSYVTCFNDGCDYFVKTPDSEDIPPHDDRSQ